VLTVASDPGGRWVVDLPDGKRILFEDSLTAELFAMRHLRESGGGEVAVHDRGRRTPRLIPIRGHRERGGLDSPHE
jgi:hypothetical protein